MTHEFKNIIGNSIINRSKGLKTVLATVVALDGSSYRKPGVRMLIAEDGTMTGAVSGGCVEKEIVLQAQQVFKSDKAKVMTYDGRYRLGCEGILYILLEPFQLSEDLEKGFYKNFGQRKAFMINSYFKKEETEALEMGSVVHFQDGTSVKFSPFSLNSETRGLSVFAQEMKPLFKVLIIGAEHDAVQMCSAVSLLGWEVTVVASPKDPRTVANFPGAAELLHITPEEIRSLKIDQETAVILMNHNYATDLKFLLSLKDENPAYIGLLGAVKRREQLFNEIIELHPEVDDTFLDKIHGPAGLDIGAVTPQEIAVAIISEILTVIRKKEAFTLRQNKNKLQKLKAWPE